MTRDAVAGSPAIRQPPDHIRALRVAVVVVVVIWHFGHDVIIVSKGWDMYPSHAAVIGAWSTLSAAQVVGSGLLLCDRLATTLAWGLAVVALGAGALATFTYPPGQALSDVSWAWNTVGWVGVLLLMHRPLRELAMLLAVNTAVTVAALVVDGSLDQVTAARLVAVTYATVGAQMLFAFVNRFLVRMFRQNAETAATNAWLAARSAAEAAVQTGRRRRYGELRDRAEPILRGLAEGGLDPADPAVRREAGIAAARLRRLFAETDDALHPLLHELRACADVAERREVDVSILSYGALPPLPATVRRALTEAPMYALASARSCARVTVVADTDRVLVSVLADAPAEILPELSAGDICVGVHEESHEVEGDQIWVESQWLNPALPSRSV